MLKYIFKLTIPVGQRGPKRLVEEAASQELEATYEHLP